MDFPRLQDITDLGYHPDVPPAAWYWRNLMADVFGPHIVIRCGHGRSATLGRRHSIAADGAVSPSIVWMRWDDATKKDVEGCCHISGARLLGWTPADAAIDRRGVDP